MVTHRVDLRNRNMDQRSVYPEIAVLSYTYEMGGQDEKTIPAAPLFRHINERGLTQSEFAEAIRESPQTITNWKRRGIPRGALLRVAKAMGVSVEQFVAQATPATTKSLAVRMRKTVDRLTQPVSVPILEIEGSGGPGRVVPTHEPIIGGLTLSQDWVRGHLPSVTGMSNLAVISVMGDSMTPTLADGDILLVDRGVTEVRLDAVYVLGRGDELFVKRLQRRLSGELVIRSDNPLFEPEIVTGAELEGIRVLGRVVWAWNGRKL